MATLASVITKKRNEGGGVFGSLAGGIKEKLKEKIDPRRLINQKGLLPALFPSLKSYQAKGAELITTSGPELQGSFSSGLEPILEKINLNNTVTAKNFITLPMLHWNLNVMNRNLIKFVRLEGGDPATKADRRYFLSGQERDKAYEAQIQKEKEIKPSPVPKKQKDSNWMFITGLVAIGTAILYQLDLLSTETIKKAVDGLLTALTGSTSAHASINYQGELGNFQALQDLHTKTFKELSETQKEAFLNKQFEMEGNKPGQIPYDLKNPGAMKYGAFAKQYGAKEGRGGFAEFPTMEKGKEAQKALWSSEAYSNLPLDEGLRKWVAPSPTMQGENSFRNYASGIAQATGISSGQPKISSGFGMRTNPSGHSEMHGGVDYPAQKGSKVVSTKNGTVSRVGFELNGYGNFIEIDHGDGMKTRYAHLSKTLVKEGESVSEGQTIGAVGNTGRSRGDHLHYEVLRDGVKVDPKLSPISQLSPVINGDLVNASSENVVRAETKSASVTPVILNNNVVTSNQKQTQKISRNSFDPFDVLFKLNSTHT